MFVNVLIKIELWIVLRVNFRVRDVPVNRIFEEFKIDLFLIFSMFLMFSIILFEEENVFDCWINCSACFSFFKNDEIDENKYSYDWSFLFVSFASSSTMIIASINMNWKSFSLMLNSFSLILMNFVLKISIVSLLIRKGFLMSWARSI